jgi:CoA-binding domain
MVSLLFSDPGRPAYRSHGLTPKRIDRAEEDRARTVIYGSGAAGLAQVQELRHNQSLKCDVVGLIDDDSRKVGLSFHGKRVLGTGETLPSWARKLAVKRVLIAIPSAQRPANGAYRGLHSRELRQRLYPHVLECYLPLAVRKRIRPLGRTCRELPDLIGWEGKSSLHGGSPPGGYQSSNPAVMAG